MIYLIAAAWFVFGVVVTLYLKRDSKTFEKRCAIEFCKIYGPDLPHLVVTDVLEDLQYKVRQAYNHFDNYRKGNLPGDRMTEMLGWSESWEDLQKEIHRWHQARDRALGLAFLCGYSVEASNAVKKF